MHQCLICESRYIPCDFLESAVGRIKRTDCGRARKRLLPSTSARQEALWSVVHQHTTPNPGKEDQRSPSSACVMYATKVGQAMGISLSLPHPGIHRFQSSDQARLWLVDKLQRVVSGDFADGSIGNFLLLTNLLTFSSRFMDRPIRCNASD